MAIKINTYFKLSNAAFRIGKNILSDIVSNLILSLDATNITSYPGSGTTWYDISGYGNNATLTAATASNFSNYAVKFKNFNDQKEHIPFSWKEANDNSIL